MFAGAILLRPAARSDRDARSEGVESDEQTPGRPWYGRFELQGCQVGKWRIGPLTLWIQRLQGEWRIAQQTTEDPMDDGLALQIPADEGDLLRMDAVDRFGVEGQSPLVELSPALADRPVVARPEKPFHVPAGEKVTVFVGSPLWVTITAPPAAAPLLDQPIFRPSDTWFGPTTMEGELCYASRTYLRLNLETVVRRPHRALTVVNILNRSETSLSIESLKLPVARLTLYQSADGQLWTQDVTFERDKDGDFAALRVRKRTPGHAGDATLVAQPRQTNGDNPVVRAFSAIFSTGGGPWTS